jgi:hypothetical protein
MESSVDVFSRPMLSAAGTFSSIIVSRVRGCGNRYEQKIEILDGQLQENKDKATIVMDFSIPYRTALIKVTEIAKSPYKIWTSATLSEKKKLFNFFFGGKIKYDLKSRYRTVNPSVLYRFFGDLSENNADVEMGVSKPRVQIVNQ